MKNVRDWISNNPKIFAGICTALLIITMVLMTILPMVAYVIISAIVFIVSLVCFVQLTYTLILGLVEEFLC